LTVDSDPRDGELSDVMPAIIIQLLFFCLTVGMIILLK
jgi:hypothetical protein